MDIKSCSVCKIEIKGFGINCRSCAVTLTHRKLGHIVVPRKCITCSSTFSPKNYSKTQKYCRKKCQPAWNKGKKLDSRPWNAGKKNIYSAETRRKMGVANKGVVRDESFRLRVSRKLTKGNTPLLEAIRKCFKYREWHKNVLAKDNFTCMSCLVRGGRLEADHHPKMFIELVKENNIENLEKAIGHNELWRVENGRTLCNECHRKIGRRIPSYANN